MQRINSILQIYGKASGQEINLEKFVIVFSKNAADNLRIAISKGLGVRQAEKHEKYLGLPSVVGRSRKEVFSSLRDKRSSGTNPTSLTARLIQARYYLGLYILDANLGTKSSLTWRSIFSTKAIIQAGYRWYIEDGARTRIWIDLWMAFSSTQIHRPKSSIASLDSVRAGWKGIWKAKVPNKIKSNVCVIGLLFLNGPPMLEIGSSMHNENSIKEISIFLVTGWSIWWGHNRKWTKDDTASPIQTVAFARNYLDAFSGFLEHHPCLKNPSAPTTWTTPPTDYSKLNVGTAIFNVDGEIAAGIVARNIHGFCLAWTAIRDHRLLSPEAAEAWAARIAVQFANSAWMEPYYH
ncbi:UNVERIFIED_CONTAM: hypothetical protein Sradi_0758100 [Sesamum radiatum]|uniref:RNase H type-1 domain-containing protein n=1 Tax=Sesamum radiatum TaxID=300843 RepID=A0AAW2VTY7_SESRA